MIVRITPEDVLFFRKGRPFTMGEGHRGDGATDPPPTTVYAAVRTTLAFEAGYPVERFRTHRHPQLGDQDRVGSLRLRGPFLVVEQAGSRAVAHPVPGDLIASEAEPARPQRLRVVEAVNSLGLRGGAWDVMQAAKPALPHLLVIPTIEPAGRPEGWLDVPGMARYLCGESVRETFRSSRPVAAAESRVGLALNGDRRTPEDGMLYAADFLRLRDEVSLRAGYAVIIEGHEPLSLRLPGTMALGGEGRRVQVTACDELQMVPEFPETALADPSVRGFLIYLATPALFEDGWCPGWIDQGSLRVRTAGNPGVPVGARLVSAALDKPAPLWRWNLAAGRPRSLDLMVPAGSVYRFEWPETERSDCIQALRAVHGQCVSDRGDTASMGCGVAFVGAWTHALR